jgi:hypothetical protein
MNCGRLNFQKNFRIRCPWFASPYLASLWTGVGENRIKRAHFESLRKVLGHRSSFRAKAAGQVAETTAQLELLSEDLIRLRKVVAGQVFALDIPIEGTFGNDLIRKGVQKYLKEE